MSFDFKIEGGDLKVSNTGDLAIVENSEKLVQDILKIASTPIGGNIFFPWYGSPISKTLVGTAYETQFISNIATRQLQTSLETLQNLQKEQLKSSQVVTPQEQIAAVKDIDVNRNSIDPRFFTVSITVLSKAFTRVQTSFAISL